MKNRIIQLLQKILGFERFLFIFSVFIIHKLRFDKNEKDFLKIFNLIEEDGLILDIGANIGVMTVHFAKRMKNSLVYAFEPIPYNVRTLKRIVRFYKLSNVKIFDNALGDRNENLKMILPVIKSARKQGLSHVIDTENANDNIGELFSVVGKRIDDIEEIRDSVRRITAIKIDVEGFELNVLKGAAETIRKFMPVIYCELWDGPQRNEAIQYLQSFGYVPKIVISNKLLRYNGHPNHNFFFLKENN